MLLKTKFRKKVIYLSIGRNYKIENLVCLVKYIKENYQKRNI